MDLELRPSLLYVYFIYLFTQLLSILVTLLQVIRGQADKVDLKRHMLPLFCLHLCQQFLNIIDNACWQDV